MDFITGVGLGNAAIAATAAYGAKDKTFEEKFNERIKVYEDEKKSLEKMIEILKKEKAACEATKTDEVRPAEPVPVTATAPTETNATVSEVPVPGPEIPQPQPTVEPLNQELLPEMPLQPEPVLGETNTVPVPGPEPQPTVEPLNQELLPEMPLQPEPAAAPILETAPTETNTLVPEVPVPGPEIPQPQPTVEPLNQELLPEMPLQPEIPLFPEGALPPGPPPAPPESAPRPPVAAAATRRSLYQRSLQDARQAVEADVRQFPSMDATVARPLPALPPRPPSSFTRPDFNPSEERTTFAPTRGRTRGGRITRKKKLRTRRATKQKNV